MDGVKYFRILLSLSVLITVGLSESISAEIKDYDKLMQEASFLRLGGKPDEAEVIYSDVLSKNPDDTDALVGRGFSRMRDKKYYDEAIADFKKDY